MRKWTRPIVFAIVAAALAGGAMTAQEKKATAAQGKKEVKGKVEYYEAGDGWRYKVLNAEGKTIMMSARGLAGKEDAIKMLEEVKTIMTNVKPTEGASTKKDKEKDTEKKDKKDKKDK